jgi:hypothetical protein
VSDTLKIESERLIKRQGKLITCVVTLTLDFDLRPEVKFFNRGPKLRP